jgi:hypothetical protein
MLKIDRLPEIGHSKKSGKRHNATSFIPKNNSPSSPLNIHLVCLRNVWSWSRSSTFLLLRWTLVWCWKSKAPLRSKCRVVLAVIISKILLDKIELCSSSTSGWSKTKSLESHASYLNPVPSSFLPAIFYYRLTFIGDDIYCWSIRIQKKQECSSTFQWEWFSTNQRKI